jgi:hypothetical protein
MKSESMFLLLLLILVKVMEPELKPILERYQDPTIE